MVAVVAAVAMLAGGAKLPPLPLAAAAAMTAKGTAVPPQLLVITAPMPAADFPVRMLGACIAIPVYLSACLHHSTPFSHVSLILSPRQNNPPSRPCNTAHASQ
ncbi:hypothetical protein VaNZ11_001528 [Volvox africanus]|uniref:Secreted protein n=1 Tax=Volvox africanus TaxID=51714 RepID=A0ABQ5RQS3_9CHLO|nr:hypothetical protein VaNZ11_001528 [Volvox africanus]